MSGHKNVKLLHCISHSRKNNTIKKTVHSRYTSTNNNQPHFELISAVFFLFLVLLKIFCRPKNTHTFVRQRLKVKEKEMGEKEKEWFWSVRVSNVQTEKEIYREREPTETCAKTANNLIIIAYILLYISHVFFFFPPLFVYSCVLFVIHMCRWCDWRDGMWSETNQKKGMLMCVKMQTNILCVCWRDMLHAKWSVVVSRKFACRFRCFAKSRLWYTNNTHTRTIETQSHFRNRHRGIPMALRNGNVNNN